MADIFAERLEEITRLVETGPTASNTRDILRLLDGPDVPLAMLEQMKLYSETLPRGHEKPFTPYQRHLHFLWDMFDRTPLSLMVPFSLPFRRLLASKLFAQCGLAFVCEENVRFNYGQLLELGDNVFFNRGCFLDSKGGIRIGDSVALAEDVRIFTHTHSEASHMVREYHPVVIESYAKIYAGVTIMPGVTIGSQAIVASGSLVTKDVPPNTVVAGMPARGVRERHTDGRQGEELDHLWLY